MSAANYKRARIVITHETRIYLWGESPGVDWTTERRGLRMNVCFILVSARVRRRSFSFVSLFLRGIDESGEEKKLSFSPVPSSAFTSSPLIVRGYSSFDPLKLHPGGHRHKELWGKVVVMVGGWPANLSRGGSSYPERKRHWAIFRALKTQRRHEKEDIFLSFYPTAGAGRQEFQ